MMPLSRRVAATLLPLLVLLSELWVSHADFLGGLAKLDPGKVVDTIKKGSKLDPEKVVNTITKGQPQDLGKEVLKAGGAIAQAGKEKEVSQAVGAVVDAGKAVATLAGNGQLGPQSGQASLMNAHSPAAADVGKDGDVGKDLSGAVPKKVRSELEKGVNSILGGLRPAMPQIKKTIQQSSPAIQQVQKTLSDPKKAKQIEEAVKNLAPKVADTINKLDPEKVIRAEKVLEEADPAVDTVLTTIDRAQWWGSHWQLWLTLALGAIFATAVCCKLTASEGGSSSLLDAEINQYLNAGSQQNSEVQLTEEACFRQF